MNTEYAEILSELRELNRILKQIEQNTQTNGSLIVPKELIALFLTAASAAPKTSIFGGK